MVHCCWSLGVVLSHGPRPFAINSRGGETEEQSGIEIGENRRKSPKSRERERENEMGEMGRRRRGKKNKLERRVEPSQTTEFHLYTSAGKLARTSQGLNHIGRDSRDPPSLPTCTPSNDVHGPPRRFASCLILPVASSGQEKERE